MTERPENVDRPVGRGYDRRVADKRSGDTFRTFLRVLHDEDEPVESTTKGGGTDNDGVRIVMTLKERGTTRLNELQRATELPAQRFLDALDVMHESGFVELDKREDGQHASLTDRGDRFAELDVE